MEIVFIVLGFSAAAYLILTLISLYIVHQFPRSPVDDAPDWGTLTDAKISARDGGFLEVWRVMPGR